MPSISAFRPSSFRLDSLRQRSRRKQKQRERGDTVQHLELENELDNLDEVHAIITPSKHTPKSSNFLKGRIAAAGSLLRPFRLLRHDLQNLRLRYSSDWTTFNQLIFASAVYVFFTNLLPGITFANDLYVLTGQNWGTIEVVFSTGLCGLIFSLLSIQPLTILGVTGPFSVLAENMYSLCTESLKIPFLPFMAWSLIHAGWLHYVLAIINAHDWTMRYVTTFSTEIFSLLNSIIYFHKAIQELQRTHDDLSFSAFLYAIIGAVGTMFLAMFLSTAESWKPLFHRYIRMGFTEYAAAISIVIFIGLPHVGQLSTLDKSTLHISTSFRPTSPDRTIFFVEFWKLPITWIFAAIIPGLIITILFFFDHEVSSIICTIDRYGTKKPGGFAWDIMILGTTTALCGMLGIPPANGLLPQAPLHSESLMHIEKQEITTVGEQSVSVKEVQVVYEQRWSSFLHASGILLFISPPFMHVLGLVPTSVLAGLFLFMGEQSLSVKYVSSAHDFVFPLYLLATFSPLSSPILYRAFYILTPPSELPPLPTQSSSHTFAPFTYAPIHTYTLLQIVITVAIFILTLTKAAPAFPILIIALVPIRLLYMKKWFNSEVLRFVDAWACKVGTPEDEEDEMNGNGVGPVRRGDRESASEVVGTRGEAVDRGETIEHGSEPSGRIDRECTIIGDPNAGKGKVSESV